MLRFMSNDWGGEDPAKIKAAVEQITGVTQATVREGEPERPRGVSPVQAAIPEPESKFLPRGLLFDLSRIFPPQSFDINRNIAMIDLYRGSREMEFMLN